MEWIKWVRAMRHARQGAMARKAEEMQGAEQVMQMAGIPYMEVFQHSNPIERGTAMNEKLIQPVLGDKKIRTGDQQTDLFEKTAVEPYEQEANSVASGPVGLGQVQIPDVTKADSFLEEETYYDAGPDAPGLGSMDYGFDWSIG